MTIIALLPGDGIGPEVLEGPVELLRRLEKAGAPIELTGPWPYGSTGWRETGQRLADATIEACQDADVALSGAIGTHPGIDPRQFPNPEAGLIALRHRFDLRVSIRTIWVPGHDDVTVVRTITGGAYGEPHQHHDGTGDDDPARDEFVLAPGQIAEVVRIAAGFAASQPTRRHISCDKASVLATSRLWRRIVDEIPIAEGHHFEHVNVDRAAYELVANPDLPGVLVAEGLFGDILSDVVCARAGSPALCGSATINPDGPQGNGIAGLFEPAHGSAPRHAGTRRSNPTGAWLATAQLLDWCPDTAPLGLGPQVRKALEATYEQGLRTYDLAGGSSSPASLDELNTAVLDKIGDGAG